MHWAEWLTNVPPDSDTMYPQHLQSTFIQKFSEFLYLIINEPQGQLRSTDVCGIRLFVSTSSEAHWPRISPNACTLSSASRKASWGPLKFAELEYFHPQVIRNILIQKFSECLYSAIHEPQGQLTSTEVCRIRFYSFINEPQGQLSFTEVCRIRIFFSHKSSETHLSRNSPNACTSSSTSQHAKGQQRIQARREEAVQTASSWNHQGNYFGATRKRHKPTTAKR